MRCMLLSKLARRNRAGLSSSSRVAMKHSLERKIVALRRDVRQMAVLYCVCIVSMALLGTTRSYTFMVNSGMASAKVLARKAASNTSR